MAAAALRRWVAAAAIAFGASGLLHAQSVPASGAAVGTAATAPAAAAVPDRSLADALGGPAGIARLVDEFVDRVVADPRIGPQFAKTNLVELKKQLSDQFCLLAGGGCRYQGAKMGPSHADLGVTKRDFHAMIEDLQQAMDAQGVPITTQNRLLALLAPMHRDIVTAH